MKFTEVEVDENFPLRKFESVNHVWEWGLTPMIFGVRIRAGMVGEIGCELDYCAGADLNYVMLWLGFISAIMSMLPEEVTPQTLNSLFPKQSVEPLSNDQQCMDKLFKLAATLRDTEGATNYY
jgi:hypothetical protein